MFENLTNQNCEFYAIKCYDTPTCLPSEFEGDYNRLKYVKRLLRKYKSLGQIKERLILNHIICLSNVFGVEAATRLLFLRVDNKDFATLKAFLSNLNYLPDIVKGINGRNIKVDDIIMDEHIVNLLKEI